MRNKFEKQIIGIAAEMGEGREAGGKLERGQSSDQLNKQCIKTNAFPQ